MKKPFKILVAVDFSQNAMEALVWSISLARRAPAEVVLVSAVEWPGTVLPADYDFPRFYDADEGKRILVENRLRELAASSPWLTDHPPKLLARFGAPADQILRAAGEEEADLVVMGTHGRRGVSRVLMGSVAEAVVRRAPCPVTVLRSGVHPAPERMAVLGMVDDQSVEHAASAPAKDGGEGK